MQHQNHIMNQITSSEDKNLMTSPEAGTIIKPVLQTRRLRQRGVSNLMLIVRITERAQQLSRNLEQQKAWMVLLRTCNRDRGLGTNELRVWNKKVYNHQAVFPKFPYIMKCQYLPFQHLGKNNSHDGRIKQVHNPFKSHRSAAERRTEISKAMPDDTKIHEKEMNISGHYSVNKASGTGNC